MKETHSAKRIKGFSCRDQFIAMIFCQFGQAHSLHEICGELATSLGKMLHLGMKKAPSRSILSYANAQRPWQMYSVRNREYAISIANGGLATWDVQLQQ